MDGEWFKMPVKYSGKSSSGIPFGQNSGRPNDPQFGQPYFNGEASRLELYTSSTGWQNIVQETPSVVSLTGTYKESNQSNTIIINGTNFAAGAMAYAIGTNEVEVLATSTTVDSVVSISAVFSGLSAAYEPYDIKVANPSNLYGVLYNALQIDDMPVIAQQSGSLGTYLEGTPVSISLTSSDEDTSNISITYSVSSGVLPAGLSLNANTGVISGTVSDVIPNTTYPFSIVASNNQTSIARNFSITVQDSGPVWPSAVTLPAFSRGVPYSQSVSATDDNSSISYSIFSGALPGGLSLSTSGVISGTPTTSIHTNVTIRATDNGSGNYADKQVSLTNAGPTWTTTSIPAYTPGSPFSYTLLASDDSENTPTFSIVSGTLPTGLSMSSSGVISGTVASSITSSVTFRVTDSNGSYADQQLTLSGLLYVFSSHTFSTAGKVGRYGPSLSQLQSAYSTTTWASNSSLFTLGRSDGYQVWTVPKSGNYRFTMAGARGNNGTNIDDSTHGRGAKIQATVYLSQGQKLEMLVGQVPGVTGAVLTSGAAGGGGGTFVVNYQSNDPILVAAGGGGRYSITSAQSIRDGQTKRVPRFSGYNYSPAVDGSHPQAGYGGFAYHAGGGGGLLGGSIPYPGQAISVAVSSTTPDTSGQQYTYGASFSGSNDFGTFYGIGGNISGSYTESYGGFGGGGGGHSGNNAAGGGGGYSGGHGGQTAVGGSIQDGVGGGSFIIPSANSVSTSDGQYDGSSTFNGLSIGTLGTHNDSGYITIESL